MKVLVGLSGGLDSAYAALKLKREGHTVEGAVLVMHEFTETDAARKVADLLEIPLHVIDCTELFEQRVKSYFAKEYSLGRTPNPCVLCNREVKIKGLYEYALANGFDRIASGHYSSIARTRDGATERTVLKRCSDLSKDQTYMLCMLESEILDKFLLPLSDLTKEEIREEVKKIGLSVLDREESQEICFLPQDDYPSFVEERMGKFPEGDFVLEDGTVLGRHKGIINYTVGQRKGLGISYSSRLFVTRIDPVSNKIILSDTPAGAKVIKLSGVNLFLSEQGEECFTVNLSLQHRYRAGLTEVKATFFADGTATLYSDEPIFSVTPGQAAALYKDDMLFCGGYIVSAD